MIPSDFEEWYVQVFAVGFAILDKGQTRGNTETSFKHIAVLYVARQTYLPSTSPSLSNKENVFVFLTVWLVLNGRPMLSNCWVTTTIGTCNSWLRGKPCASGPHNPRGQGRHLHWSGGRTAGIWKQANNVALVPHVLHTLQGLTRPRLVDIPGFVLC